MCVRAHVHKQSLAGGHVVLCLPYGSPIELKSHQPGQQAHLPWSHLVNVFFYLSEAEACPFGYTASQQAPGICLSLLASWVKSAHYYVWFLYVLGIQSLHFTHYAIPPALLKPNLGIQICMYQTPSSPYRETTKSKRKLALRPLRHQLLRGHK